MITQEKDTDTSSESEISTAPDIESLISVSQADSVPSESKGSCSRLVGQVSLQLYMICHVGIASHALLAQHLKFFHPQERPHNCVHCSANFNTYPDLRSHISNIHKSEEN